MTKSGTSRDASAILSAFAFELSFDTIPEEVRRTAACAILDAVGVAIAASSTKFAAQATAAVLAAGSRGETPVLGMDARLQPRDAAFVNGILVHGLDFDDTHLRSAVHATASLLPTLLAVAHGRPCSGADMVTAYVAGLEAVARLGIYGGIHLRETGFHTTSVLGVFGCAIAAGKLIGLSIDQLRMSQGIALSMASGRIGSAADGASNKRLHPGWAAQSGIMAAFLAQSGFHGPDRPYEGVQGLFKTMDEDKDAIARALGLSMADLGRTWESLSLSIKPIPACHLTHACADAAAIISNMPGFEPASVRRIVALVPSATVPIVCEPLMLKRAPATSYAAQFSIPYVVAASLVRGRFGFTELDEASLADPDILRLALLVDYADDPASTYPRHRSGEVLVELADGKVLRHREAINRGAPERPLSEADIEAKFRQNVHFLGVERSDDLVSRILAISDWANGREAIEDICRPNGQVVR